MFVEPNETVSFKIYYKKNRDGYTALTQISLEKIKKEKQSEFQSINITMKKISWGISNELQETAIVRGINGERVWNHKIYKENKMKNLLTAWDAKKKNEKGELISVPVNNENILKLAPDIAEAILAGYDEVTQGEEGEASKENKEE